jgi:hypothetical protein
MFWHPPLHVCFLLHCAGYVLHNLLVFSALILMCLAQDTPSLLNAEHLAKVKAMIGASRDAHFEVEQDPLRKGPMTQYPDPRIDACIYFIAPHGSGQNDIRFMSELADFLPVVPVLAKVTITLPLPYCSLADW